ncbi:MAG: hypothetical protein LBF43_01865, partial [Puniceicoccales bacterium]|nr:hypothetical protein [Puniceicoccales bacterium]
MAIGIVATSLFSKGVEIEELFDLPELQSLAKVLAQENGQSIKVLKQLQELMQSLSKTANDLCSKLSKALDDSHIQQALQQLQGSIQLLSEKVETLPKISSQQLQELVQHPTTRDELQALLKSLAQFQALIKLNETFNKLQNLEGGRIITQKLKELLQKESKKINGGKIAIEYSLPSGGSIGANIKKSNQGQTYDLFLIGVLELNVMLPYHLLGQHDINRKAYIVLKKALPPYIVLGHELLHLIDGLQNLEAFVEPSKARTFKKWVEDNAGCVPIEALVKHPYFQKTFCSQKNIYEELYVYFGTNESRQNKIPTENDLLIEAGIGLKIGYSLKGNYFYIEEEVVNNLCSIYDKQVNDIRLTDDEAITFSLVQALQNSPSFIRTRGRCCLTRPTVQAEAKAELQPLIFSRIKAMRIARKKMADKFCQAYNELAQQIDRGYERLPPHILEQPGITSGYRFNLPGSKVSFIFDKLPRIPPGTDVKFEFFLDSELIGMELVDLPQCELEGIRALKKLTRMPEKVQVSFICRQIQGMATPPQLQPFTIQLPEPPADFKRVKMSFPCPTGVFIPTGTRLIFDFDFEERPPLEVNSPVQTNLGFIDYEQFYNKHKKLLLQVGNGTSFEETIQLHDQIYKWPKVAVNYNAMDDDFIIDAICSEHNVGNADTVKRAQRNLILYQCDSHGKEVIPPDEFFYGGSENPVIEVVQDITSTPHLYFLVVDPDALPT